MEKKDEDEWRKGEERWETDNGIKTGSFFLYSSNFTNTLSSTTFPSSSLFLPSPLLSSLLSPPIPSPHSSVVLAASTLLRPDW